MVFGAPYMMIHGIVCVRDGMASLAIRQSCMIMPVIERSRSSLFSFFLSSSKRVGSCLLIASLSKYNGILWKETRCVLVVTDDLI
jgi:hypothetical protein